MNVQITNVGLVAIPLTTEAERLELGADDCYQVNTATCQSILLGSREDGDPVLINIIVVNEGDDPVRIDMHEEEGAVLTHETTAQVNAFRWIEVRAETPEPEAPAGEPASSEPDGT